MKLPADPMILYSYVNQKLRDEYESLDSLCEDLELDRETLEGRLAEAGFAYDARRNCFR